MEHTITSIGALAFAYSQNFLTTFFKKFFYKKKKLHAIYSYDSLTTEAIKKIELSKRVKIIRPEVDVKNILFSHLDLAKLQKMETDNILAYKTYIFPIYQKYINRIFKYFCSNYHIVVVSCDLELLEFLGFNKNKILLISPTDEAFSKLTQEPSILSSRVIFYKLNYKLKKEFTTTDECVKLICETFRIH